VAVVVVIYMRLLQGEEPSNERSWWELTGVHGLLLLAIIITSARSSGSRSTPSSSSRT